MYAVYFRVVATGVVTTRCAFLIILQVLKRYFRLAFPCTMALVFAWLLAGFEVHEKAAEVTKSWWLQQFDARHPPFEDDMDTFFCWKTVPFCCLGWWDFGVLNWRTDQS